MKPRRLSNNLTSALVACSLIFGIGVAASIALSPDVAFAKNDKSNGGGKDKSNRGNGRDKAERGNGKSKASKNSRGNSWFARGSEKKNKAKGKTRHAQKSDQKNKGSHTIAGLGRDLRRDVSALFGRDNDRKAKKTKSTKTRNVARIENSPRPSRRDLAAGKRPAKLRHGAGKHRDPLVVAITDRNGSDKLKNLNASKAAGAAFANASSNSNVGKIATYQEAAADYYGLRDDLTDRRRDLRKLDDYYDGRSSEEIEDEIAALDPDDPNYEAERDALNEELTDAETYETARGELNGDIRDLKKDTYGALQVAEAAFFDASKGRTLTRDALGELHQNLELPQPKDPRRDHAVISPYPKDGAEIQPVPEEGAEIQPYPSSGPHHGSRPGKRQSDPLVAAITDPDGSAKLKNLNASKAASQAFANASPNSNVGKIATYQDAAADYYGLRDEFGDKRRDLHELNEGYEGRTSEEILDDIADLDPSDPGYEDSVAELEEELADAGEFEDARAELFRDVRELRRETLIASKQAEIAFFEAAKGQILTPGALAELHSNLGLPAPIR